jgi:hypothetical protein
MSSRRGGPLPGLLVLGLVALAARAAGPPAGAVAKAVVGIFAFSTFETDHLLVKEAVLLKGVAARRAAGHRVDAEGVAP